jgi:hypothetical protein
MHLRSRSDPEHLPRSGEQAATTPSARCGAGFESPTVGPMHSGPPAAGWASLCVAGLDTATLPNGPARALPLPLGSSFGHRTHAFVFHRGRRATREPKAHPRSCAGRWAAVATALLTTLNTAPDEPQADHACHRRPQGHSDQVTPKRAQRPPTVILGAPEPRLEHRRAAVHDRHCMNAREGSPEEALAVSRHPQGHGRQPCSATRHTGRPARPRSTDGTREGAPRPATRETCSRTRSLIHSGSSGSCGA